MWSINHCIGKTNLEYKSNQKYKVYKYALDKIKNLSNDTQEEFINNIDKFINKEIKKYIPIPLDRLIVSKKRVKKYNIENNEIWGINLIIYHFSKKLIHLEYRSQSYTEVYNYIINKIKKFQNDIQIGILVNINQYIKKHRYKKVKTRSKEYKDKIDSTILGIQRNLKIKKKFHRSIKKEYKIEKNKTIQIFTDGSLNYLSKKAGISFCTDEFEFYKYVYAYSNSSTYYELLAILYALYFAVYNNYNNIEIITDSDEAYRIIHFQNIIFHNFIVKKIKNIIFHNNIQVKFRCIKSHQSKTNYGTIMNDKADRLAKLASFEMKNNTYSIDNMIINYWDFNYIFYLNCHLYNKLIVDNIEYIIEKQIDIN